MGEEGISDSGTAVLQSGDGWVHERRETRLPVVARDRIGIFVPSCPDTDGLCEEGTVLRRLVFRIGILVRWIRDEPRRPLRVEHSCSSVRRQAWHRDPRLGFRVEGLGSGIPGTLTRQADRDEKLSHKRSIPGDRGPTCWLQCRICARYGYLPLGNLCRTLRPSGVLKVSRPLDGMFNHRLGVEDCFSLPTWTQYWPISTRMVHCIMSSSTAFFWPGNWT